MNKLLIVMMVILSLTNVMAYDTQHSSTDVAGVVIDFIAELGIVLVTYATAIALFSVAIFIVVVVPKLMGLM